MDVIKIINSLTYQLPPEAAFHVLIALKNRWYDYHKKRYDFESWYEIIRNLTRTIGQSSEYSKKLKESFPNLLVAKKLKSNDIPKRNKRRQARAWLNSQKTKYKLVQDGFLSIGYPELEELCEENDGFNITRDPTDRELQYFSLLEEAALFLFKDFMYENKLPRCQVINNEGGAWAGMASCVPLSTPKKTLSGNKIRFSLPYIALKSYLLKKGLFGAAFSSYLHEIAHSFGGDHSASFSKVITEMLEKTLSHSHEIEKFRVLWDRIEEDRER